jgi:hypothetical protein
MRHCLAALSGSTLAGMASLGLPQRRPRSCMAPRRQLALKHTPAVLATAKARQATIQKVARNPCSLGSSCTISTIASLTASSALRGRPPLVVETGRAMNVEAPNPEAHGDVARLKDLGNLHRATTLGGEENHLRPPTDSTNLLARHALEFFALLFRHWPRVHLAPRPLLYNRSGASFFVLPT